MGDFLIIPVKRWYQYTSRHIPANYGTQKTISPDII